MTAALPAKRVAILIPADYAAGGLQRSALALAECLSREGYEPRIYSTILESGGLAGRHDFIEATSPRRKSKIAFWLNHYLSLRRLLRKDRPFAAIGFGLFPAAALGMIGAGRSGTLLVGSERAHPAAMPSGRLAGFLRRFLPRLDYLVCQTTQIADWFETSLRVPADRVAVIPNVVRSAPAGWVAPTFAPIGRAPMPMFVGAGRLDHQKGFDFALRVFQIIVRKHPEARLVIAGEGSGAAELLALRAELGLDEHVEFRPPVPDLAALWSSAYALVFPSRYEGFPNVLAEAMAHGIPAVAFDCPSGPADLIEDGVNGFLVELGDVERAAQRCIELIENPGKRDAMGASAAMVSETFGLDRIAAKWAALLKQGPKH